MYAKLNKNTSDLDVVRENERLVNDLKEKHEEEQHRWKMVCERRCA